MEALKHLVTFDGGEVSPWLDGRTDLAKYNGSCRTLENFIPVPQGGVVKRPGMQFVAKLPTAATAGVLVEFELAGANSIVLAIAGGKMRFFAAGALIESGGSPVELTIPWADSELEQLRWKQINDVMFFVHPLHAPRQLSRISNTSWTIANFVPARNQPFLPANPDNTIRITSSFQQNAAVAGFSAAPAWGSGTAYAVGARVTQAGKFWVCDNAHTSSMSNEPTDGATYFDAGEQEDRLIWAEVFVDNSSTVGQTVTLKCNKALWNANHVNGFFRLAFKRSGNGYEAVRTVDPTATGTNVVYSSVLVCQGRWTFQTFGSWAGIFRVEISRDRGKSWQSSRVYNSASAALRNYSGEGEELDRVLIRIAFFGYQSAGTSGAPYAALNVEGAYLTGIVRISELISSTEVRGISSTSIEAGTTAIWEEGAWSDHQGYPGTIEFHQNRIILGGNIRNPHTIWGSAVDDYNRFLGGTDADEPWAHTLMIGQRERIAWLLSDRVLVVGSAIGEFVLRGETEDRPITPEFGVASRQSSIGSHIRGPGAIQADIATLFVQHGGRVVRELSYQSDSDRYQTGNLNLLADHLFADEISDFAIQKYPFQIIWFVAGGKLFSLTFEKGQNIAAWARHPTVGNVISVACIRKPQTDEVWFVVDRSTTSTPKLTVERFPQYDLTEPANLGRWMDSWQTISAPLATSAAATLLAGQTVFIRRAGGDIEGPVVCNSAAFSGNGDSSCLIGLPFTAKLQPMTPEFQLANGSSRTKTQRIVQAVANVYRSRTGKLGEGPADASPDPLDMPADALISREVRHYFDGAHSVTGDITVFSDLPHPFALRALTLYVEFADPIE